MITLFENFENPIKITDYIKKEDDIFKIPNFKFEYFGEGFLKNPKYYTQIKYNFHLSIILLILIFRTDFAITPLLPHLPSS